MIVRTIIPRFISDHYRRGEFEGRFHAASLFVDISGFTSLTELLMRHGKVGAEVLTEALNSVFEPLVRTVYLHGGFISHFAGDAFTALFPTRRHHAAAYAAQTAFCVQDFFRQSGRINTEYGAITLAAKCGLALGHVHWSIVGHENLHTYYFSGDAIDGCSGAEQRARSDEIMVTAIFKAAAPSEIRATRTGEYHRLVERGTALPSKRYRPQEMERSDLEPFVDIASLEAQVQGEFRETASVFISVDETTEREVFHAFIADILRLTASYKGYFNRIMFGDKGCVILVLFGAPVSYENNVERAADFLLAIPQTVRWRAGMAFGPVYAGFVGGSARSEYTAMGDTVNLAARLMTTAPWGGIWVGDNIARWIADKGYELERVDTIRVKGKKKAVSVSSLSLTPRALVQSPEFRARLVGRQTELTTLEHAVKPIFEGHFAGVVSVHGDAGVGKSHLVYEFRTRVGEKHSVSWFGCRADAVLQQAFNPFKGLLRHYFDQSPSVGPEENKTRFLSILQRVALHAPDELRAELERTHSFLGALIGLFWPDSLFERVDAPLRRQNTHVALKILILVESLRRPAVIQIDDVHHLDPESREFVEVLTRNVEAYPFVVVTTSRYADDGSRVVLAVPEDVACVDVHLACLTARHVTDIAHDILSAPISRGLADFLMAKTDGNPFFIEQLLFDLRERGALHSDESGTWEITDRRGVEIPSTIGAVLVARLDRLTAEIKSIVQTAAVLGQEFQVHVLSELLKHDSDIIRIIRRAEDEAIWSPIGEIRYIFRHALLRDAAYDMQLRTRLRRLHTLAADAIETVFAGDISSHYVDLAFHCQRAEIPERERVYARLAGLQLRDSSSFREAIDFIDRALVLLPSDDDSTRCELLRTLGDIFISIGDYERARQSAHEALEVAQRGDDRLAAAHAVEALGNVDYKRGQYESAREWYEQSLETYEALGEQPGIATSLLYLGLVHNRTGDVNRAMEFLQKSRSLSARIGDRRGVAACLNALGGIQYRQGDYQDARSSFESSLAICRELGDKMRTAQAMNNLASIASSLGDDETAQSLNEEAFQIQQEIGDRYGSAITLNNLAFFPYARGDHSAAERLVQKSLKIARDIGDPHIIAMNLNNLGMFAGLRHDFVVARDRFEASLAVSRKLGDPRNTANTLCGLASACMELGDLEEASKRLQESLHIAEDAQATPLLLEALLGMAELYYREGRIRESAELMGLVAAHQATDAEVRQQAVPKLRAKLESILSREDLENMAAQGSEMGIARSVARALGRSDPC